MPTRDGKPRIRVVSIPLPPAEPDPGKLAVSVPARTESVRVLRSVMRSWAAAAGYFLEEIEDLCLAVDEAFSSLLAARPHPDRISVRIQEGGSGVDVTAACDAELEQWPPQGVRTSLSWQVLTKLIDDVRYERTKEGPAIRLIKHRTSPAR
jgi:anti-sigma regulatory factor (Ser/Thr protein kinase)